MVGSMPSFSFVLLQLFFVRTDELRNKVHLINQAWCRIQMPICVDSNIYAGTVNNQHHMSQRRRAQQ